MTSLDVRDPRFDQLLTPQNACLILIDYQPVQVASIRSMDSSELVRNVTSVTQIAKLFGLPVILSTVNVKTGRNKPTIDALAAVLGDVPTYDRTTINAWEDREFRDAVEATGRKKIIACALWTEACLTFPTLDALTEGFEVYPVVDAVGGTSLMAHETALRRMQQAGAHLISWVQLICELQRDWNRTATVKGFAELLFHGKEKVSAA